MFAVFTGVHGCPPISATSAPAVPCIYRNVIGYISLCPNSAIATSDDTREQEVVIRSVYYFPRPTAEWTWLEFL